MTTSAAEAFHAGASYMPLLLTAWCQQDLILCAGALVAVGGEFGGIGSNFQIWTYRVRAHVPF
jgi:hypothetical protein